MEMNNRRNFMLAGTALLALPQASVSHAQSDNALTRLLTAKPTVSSLKAAWEGFGGSVQITPDGLLMEYGEANGDVLDALITLTKACKLAGAFNV